MREMLGKSRNAVFFQWFVCPVSPKVGLLKRRVRRKVLRGDHQKLHAARGEKHILKWKCTKHVSSEAFFEVKMSQNCTPLCRKAYSEVKMLKNWRSGTTFGSSDAEKLYAAVAKCTFESQNVKKTVVLAAFFDVLLWKNCLTLWRNAHLKVKMLKNCRARSIFWRSGVEKLVR